MNYMQWLLGKDYNSQKGKPQVVVDYEAWLKVAHQRDRFVYYKGLTPAQSFVGQVVKERIWKDYEKGLVILFTQRKGENNFDYVAQRTSKPMERE